jgi:hypothetical protein
VRSEGGEDEVVREGLGLFVRCVVRGISPCPHGIREDLPGIFVSNLGLVGCSVQYVCTVSSLKIPALPSCRLLMLEGRPPSFHIPIERR